MNTVLPFVRSRTRIGDFRLLRPTVVEEVVQALHDAATGGVELMAGGVDFIDRLKAGAEVDTVVHLGRVSALQQIAMVEGRRLSIGAACRHADIAASPKVLAFAPALAALCGVLGNVRIRAKGTIGGNLLSRHPGYELAPALHALGASLHVVGRAGRRTLPVSELDGIGPDELLTSIDLPSAQGRFLMSREMRPYLSVYLVTHRDARSGQLALRAGFACVAQAPLMSVHTHLPAELGARGIAAELVAALPPLAGDTIVSSAWRRRALEVACTRLLEGAGHD
jgi:carbon-monoxide dehydrogenase medium subunit